MNKIVGIIPSHLASVRFPRKILFEIHGLPMIEHVRRRALLASGLDSVHVATCDQEIADAIVAFGGSVIMTSDTHRNGTTRIAEAVTQLDCTHALLLQGDEPLLLPTHIEAVIEAINAWPGGDAWNATAPIGTPEELDRHSFVKYAIASDGRVLYGFRRSPSVSPFAVQQTYIRKVLGLIGYRKDYLLELASSPPSVVELHESIEQMRVIERGDHLVSVPVDKSLASINEPQEAEIVLEQLRDDPVQRALLDRILG